MQKDLTKTQRLAIAAMLSERKRIGDEFADMTTAINEHVKRYAEELEMPEESKLNIGPNGVCLIYEEEDVTE